HYPTLSHHLHPGAGVRNRAADDVTAERTRPQNTKGIASRQFYFRAHRQDSYAGTSVAAIDERHSSVSFRAERGTSQSEPGSRNLSCVINELVGDPSPAIAETADERGRRPGERERRGCRYSHVEGAPNRARRRGERNGEVKR